jgi:hypothetical protein
MVGGSLLAAVLLAPPPGSEPARVFPRLEVGVHGALGPHAIGEEDCVPQGSSVECERTGRFLGAGGSIDLRARLYRFVYAHARLLAVGNAFGSGRSALYDGLLAPAAGIGISSGLALLRAEVSTPFALGSARYRAAGTSVDAIERWGHVAGGLHAGVRLRLHDRVRGELLGGLVVGPRTEGVSAAGATRDGLIVSFSVLLGTSFTLVGPVPGRS